VLSEKNSKKILDDGLNFVVIQGYCSLPALVNDYTCFGNSNVHSTSYRCTNVTKTFGKRWKEYRVTLIANFIVKKKLSVRVQSPRSRVSGLYGETEYRNNNQWWIQGFNAPLPQKYRCCVACWSPCLSLCSYVVVNAYTSTCRRYPW